MENGTAKGQGGIAAEALAGLGLGCYLGWQTVDISPTLFPSPLAGTSALLSSWGYVGTVCLVALLAAFALIAYRRGPLLRNRWMIALAAFGTSAGSALLYACGWFAPQLVPAGVVAGRLLFCTSAAFVVLWGEVLCRVKPTHTLACVAAGYATSFGICLLVAHLDAAAAPLFRTVLPLLSGAMLVALRTDLPNLPDLPSPTGRLRQVAPDGTACNADGKTVAKLPAKLPMRLFVGIGILGAIFVATNHLSETKTAVSTELYTLIAGIAVALVILGVSLAFRAQPKRFAQLYRLMTPLVIGCLLLTLVLQEGYQRYEALAIGCAWAFFRIFTWTLWGHLGARDVARGACVFAIGQIALTLSSTAAELLCTVVDLSSVPLAGAAAVIIFIAVITSALVMDEGSIARLVAARSDDGAPGERNGSAQDPEHGRTGVPAIPASINMAAVTPEEFARAASSLELSEREREITLLVLQRLDNGQICKQACITDSTLRTHLRNIYGKAEVHSREQLIELGQRLVREGRTQA